MRCTHTLSGCPQASKEKATVINVYKTELHCKAQDLDALPWHWRNSIKQTIRVKITADDIDAWSGAQCPHPLVTALKRATDTPWRLVEPVMVVEKAAPYRSVILGSDLLMRLWDCKNGDTPLPCDCEIELLLPFSD